MSVFIESTCVPYSKMHGRPRDCDGGVTVRRRRSSPPTLSCTAAVDRLPASSHLTRSSVENLLKGEPLPATITVYYFVWTEGFNGPRPLGVWPIGHRRVFWLQRDSGVLRTACDGWDFCTIGIESGSHAGYRSDPKRPPAHAVLDLLLTRGQGRINESAFARQIAWEVPDLGQQSYAVEKLRRLARA